MVEKKDKPLTIEQKIKLIEQIIGTPIIIGVICYKGKIHIHNLERYKPEFHEADDELFNPELLERIRSDYVG